MVNGDRYVRAAGSAASAAVRADGVLQTPKHADALSGGKPGAEAIAAKSDDQDLSDFLNPARYISVIPSCS